MKIMTTQKKQKGFTLIELMIVLSLIGALYYFLSPGGEAAVNAGNRVSAKSQITELKNGLSICRVGGNYARCTMAFMLAQEMIDGDKFVNAGVGENPWGGDIVTAGGLRNATITMNQVVATDCARMAESDNSVTCDGAGTITVAING